MPTTYEDLLAETLPARIEADEDYDRRHAMPPEDSTPAELLQFLLEHSGKTPSDLLPILGQRSHVHEALTGARAISTAQARKLGELFMWLPDYLYEPEAG